ncbi:RWD domain-containing protein 2B [Orchesella cincta]|uniref:RWD domain-containing protein 2B n=1 Tax=Orchesella cincta TaxID=48709 RepID=A0A1D2N3C9_ORCCI|nr:RWD domain-containing protein 2B [Orchesella cincta]
MYDPADLHFHDVEVLNLVENCIPISDSVSLTIRINEDVELDIRLPLGYPETERLSAHCRISTKNPACMVDRNVIQQWESTINNDLFQQYLSKSANKSEDDRDQNEDSEVPNILGVIQWCNEQFEKQPVPKEQNAFFNSNTSGNKSQKNSHSTQDELCRIWIFSHHIYNKTKRKFLVNKAEELDLSGFSLPGKPGFVCVEGDPQNCDDYWSQVRQLCWQKISLIERQLFPPSQMIFEGKPFEELHCDKSAFIKFLEERNSSSVIKEYLGI